MPVPLHSYSPRRLLLASFDRFLPVREAPIVGRRSPARRQFVLMTLPCYFVRFCFLFLIKMMEWSVNYDDAISLSIAEK